jgi:hypothetical protein
MSPRNWELLNNENKTEDVKIKFAFTEVTSTQNPQTKQQQQQKQCLPHLHFKGNFPDRHSADIAYAELSSAEY